MKREKSLNVKVNVIIKISNLLLSILNVKHFINRISISFVNKIKIIFILKKFYIFIRKVVNISGDMLILSNLLSISFFFFLHIAGVAILLLSKLLRVALYRVKGASAGGQTRGENLPRLYI
jgi:hypothetical protein